jgi:prophage DNA circulation protein
MEWRKQLRPASFRGIGFEARARTMKGGRRIAEHVFPQRDEAFPEDLGRKNRGWSIEAFLFGPGYMAARDDLVKALEAKGAGEYIDLWGSTQQVVCRDFSLAENIAQGGYCSFAIDFLAYSLEPLHAVRTDTGYVVVQQAADTRAVLVEDFGRSFTVRGNDSLLSSATAMVDELLGDMDGALRVPGAALSPLQAGVSGVTGRMAQFRGGLGTLMGLPGSLGGNITGLLSSVLGLFQPGWSRYQAAQRFSGISAGGSAAIPGGYGASWQAVAPTTPTRAQQAVNQAAMLDLVRGVALTEAADASAAIPFVVYDDAVAVREELAGGLDARMASAPDPVYRAMSGLRTATVRDITTRGADLSRLSEVEIGATMPALVVAHRLYGDAGREADVLARNPSIRHPGFVPGGAILRVPTND